MHPEIAIRSVIGLLGLWFAAYYLWRDFRYDAFREDIFSVRDEMFLYAAKGNIGLSHPAYSILRHRMNVLIRHGHELRLTSLLAAMFDERPPEEHDLYTSLEVAMADLSEDVSARMREFNVRVAIFVFQHAVYYSLLRYMVIRPLMVGIKIRKVIEKPKVSSTVERLERETVALDARKTAASETTHSFV